MRDCNYFIFFRCLKILKDEYINELMNKYGETSMKNLGKVMKKYNTSIQSSIRDISRRSSIKSEEIKFQSLQKQMELKST